MEPIRPMSINDTMMQWATAQTANVSPDWAVGFMDDVTAMRRKHSDILRNIRRQKREEIPLIERFLNTGVVNKLMVYRNEAKTKLAVYSQDINGKLLFVIHNGVLFADQDRTNQVRLLLVEFAHREGLVIKFLPEVRFEYFDAIPVKLKKWKHRKDVDDSSMFTATIAVNDEEEEDDEECEYCCEDCDGPDPDVIPLPF